ncbi:MAG: ABC transporter ATP-binding protein [Pseudomonadota bacterium]|nr:ABC transporter ATP-binding protein [Pseudomonadota bacterium]
MDVPRNREVLLEVRELRTHFYTDAGVLPSVDGVSFTVHRGEAVGIVGESGCGKSVMSMSILRLIPQPPGRIVGGQILFHAPDRAKGQAPIDLVTLPMKELRRVRGNRIAMIFQEPMTSLNPVYTVGDQIAESVILHQGLEPEEAREVAIRMLEEVGIPAAKSRVDEYPHQMSGGMKQRVMIAMALACNPDLLIADEPTTALDVTIQAQILALLDRERAHRGMAIILITHDLGVVSETCDRVVVMYAGHVVETAPTADIFARPVHPYTRGLLASLPGEHGARERLATIEGMVPSPLDFPSGCRFRSRCTFATAVCATPPPRVELGPEHAAWCHHPQHGAPPLGAIPYDEEETNVG